MKAWGIVMIVAWVTAAGLVATAQETSAPPVQPAVPETSAPPAQAASDGVARPSGEAADLVSGGRQSLQEEKWTEASALFEKALSLDAGNQEAMFGLSAAYIQLSKFDAALPLLLTLNRQLPANPMVKNNLAWVYLKSKDPGVKSPSKAVKLARDAILDVPADYSIWNTLAEAYYATGQFDRALRAAQSAVRLSLLAGVTNNTASRELLVRCRKAAGANALDGAGDDQ
jgi:tetratricopeptide (TPR) repeat protein